MRSLLLAAAVAVGVFLVLLLRPGGGEKDAKGPAGSAGAAELVAWKDPAAAPAPGTAAVLYDFTADWCGPCRRLDREVFSDPGIAADVNRRFVAVRVLDREREEGRNSPAVEALQRRFRVDAFPTLVVATPEGWRDFRGFAGKDATREFLEGKGGAELHAWVP